MSEVRRGFGSCLYCGARLTLNPGPGRPRLYCGRACVRRASYQRKTATGGCGYNEPTPTRRDKALRTKYRLSLADYERVLAEQNGGCAICGTTTPGGRGGRFHVDHDHACCPTTMTCGRCVRGLLCARCNLIVGLVETDGDKCRAYVDRYKDAG